MASAAGTALAAEEKETTVAMDKLPPAVSAALEKAAGHEKIQKVSKEMEKGKPVYEGQFKVKGMVREVTVTEAGKIVSEEQTVEITAVPAKVRATIEAESAGGKIFKVEEVKEDGKTNYEALVEAKGKKSEIVIDPSGKVIEREDKSHESAKD